LTIANMQWMLANTTESQYMPRWMILLTKAYYVRSNLQEILRRNANKVADKRAVIVIN